MISLMILKESGEPLSRVKSKLLDEIVPQSLRFKPINRLLAIDLARF